jgi:hypothetical protein
MLVPQGKGTLGTQLSHHPQTWLGKGPNLVHTFTFCLSSTLRSDSRRRLGSDPPCGWRSYALSPLITQPQVS